MKKILIIHNILWSHYKAVVFNELNDIIKTNGDELLVVHIAPTATAQKKLGDADFDLHQYPHKILFNEDFEKIGNFKMSLALCREIFLYKPDVVMQAGLGEIPFWFALFATKLLRIPSIIGCDSTAMDNPKIWWKHVLKKIYVRNCSIGLCYGSKARDYLLTLGISSDRVIIDCQAVPNEEIAAIYKSAHIERRVRLPHSGLSRAILFM